jgi:hypothetical protein
VLLIPAVSAVSLAFAITSGFAAQSWNGFDWVVAASAGTAVGTFSLAVATLALVRVTADLAQQGSAEVRAQDRPVILIEQIVESKVFSVVTFPDQTRQEPWTQLVSGVRIQDGTVALSIRNVGRGPALDLRGELDVGADVGLEEPNLKGLALRAGDTWAVSWSGLPRDTLEGRGRILYRDISGFDYATNFRVSAQIPGPGAIDQQTFEIDPRT